MHMLNDTNPLFIMAKRTKIILTQMSYQLSYILPKKNSSDLKKWYILLNIQKIH